MNLNKILAETITKTAAKAVRKPLAGLRRDVAMLKRELAGIKRQLRSLGMGSGCGDVGRTAADTEAAKPPRIRPTGPMVRKLRLRLGLTQAQLAALAGVSTLTVGKWEKAGGRIGMRPAALAGLARVRAMGKRQIKVALTETASSGK